VLDVATARDRPLSGRQLSKLCIRLRDNAVVREGQLSGMKFMEPKFLTINGQSVGAQ